jgi:hypothetical protein
MWLSALELLLHNLQNKIHEYYRIGYFAKVSHWVFDFLPGASTIFAIEINLTFGVRVKTSFSLILIAMTKPIK